MMCVLYTFIYMAGYSKISNSYFQWKHAPQIYWTLLCDGNRYTFDTYRELKEFSQQLSDERAQRLEQNVRPWLSIDNRTVSQTYD